MSRLRSILTTSTALLALQLCPACSKDVQVSTTPPVESAEAAPLHTGGSSHRHDHCHVDPETATLGCHAHSHEAGPGHH
jgi:hypothetical protein